MNPCTCPLPPRLTQAPISKVWAVSCPCGRRGVSDLTREGAVLNWNQGRMGFHKSRNRKV